MIPMFKYEPGETYTEEALDFDLKVMKALRPLFEEGIDKGLSIRHMYTIASLAASVLMSELCMKSAAKFWKDKREARNG